MDERIFFSYNPWRTGNFVLPAGIVERDIHAKAVKLLKEREILTLLGLRQTGKSTLAFQLIRHLLLPAHPSPPAEGKDGARTHLLFYLR